VFKAMLTFLFLAMWLPAANCCLLQNLTLFEYDCCAAAESQKTSCDEACSLAVSLTPNSNEKAIVAPPVFFLETLVVEFDLPLLESRSAPFVLALRDEFSKQWRFKERAALPVRAPSLLS
jgi:hypothetical protein